MSAANEALNRIETARRYTLNLLNSIPTSNWFRMPSEGVTHVAWQVGHLAFAEYRLALERIRGQRPGDVELFPPAYHALFGRNSVPQADPALYPRADEIAHVLDGIHRAVQTEVGGMDDAALKVPTSSPHPQFTTKLGALDWCARHEMVHAGQIALLRRLFGSCPLW